MLRKRRYATHVRSPIIGRVSLQSHGSLALPVARMRGRAMDWWFQQQLSAYSVSSRVLQEAKGEVKKNL